MRARSDTMAPVKHQSLMLSLLIVAGGVTLAHAQDSDTSPAPAAVPEPAAAPEAAAPTNVDNSDITEIVIQAPEPRYVAPTRRDQIGRIWAPVFILSLIHI